MIIPIIKVTSWWNELGYNASIMLGCCLIAVPFLAAIDMIDEMRGTDDA